jgi:hypothetical protein
VIADIDLDVILQIADMHAVYRMFGEMDDLLYIGSTARARRFDEHAVKRWFPAVRYITLDWHATETEARKAEQIAIKLENPRYNIRGAPPPGQGVLTAPMRKVVAAPIPAEKAPERDVLADVLAVFCENPGLHWAVLAERLAQRWPDRWADVTAATISAQCRALGVRSVCVRMGIVLKGCRRVAVEKAMGGRIVTVIRPRVR